MNFSKKRPVKIVMLGAGGTGAHIAPHLYRLLYALERPVKFIICDGDKVEPKNLVRQNFTEADLGENKARVIAERYSDVFGLETSYIPRFIEDAGQLEELLRPEVFRHYVYGSEPNTGRWVTNSELVILIGAVDNNKSRKLCHEVFLRARDLVYIDSGNGEYTGQIVCGIRRAGKTVYKPVGMLYPEVSTPEDLFPTEVSCAEASVSAPQTIVVPLSPDAQKIVQGNPSAVPLRAAVWSQAAERMKPLLGGVCSRFSPAVAPYGEPLHLPFGVALGGAEAEQFLLCYFHARENQEEEIRSRTQAIRALGRKVGQFHPDEETTLTVMAFRSSDPELHKQMDVAQRFFSDDITAAAGLYYLGFGSNYINEQQERQILSNPEAYALCVAELQPVEEAAR